MYAPDKKIILKPIPESPADFDLLEKRLSKFFREFLYLPILKEMDLPQRTLKNAKDSNPLMDGLFTGRVTYSDGRFSGKFNAGISRELRALGATFDRKTATYKLPLSKVPIDVRQGISASITHFNAKLARIDAKLAKLIPAEVAKHFKCADLFDKTLWKAERSFKKNVENIAVVPHVSEEERAKISAAYQDNLRLYIKDWSEEQIKELRAKITQGVLTGQRRASFVAPILKITKTIQGSHEEALNKAKFLAHQESRIMVNTFKQARYEAAGSKSYLWRCVHRPHDPTPTPHIKGNVRYSHGLLDKQEFKWSEPPVTTNPGQTARRNHPGMDYNCRCFARPVLQVKHTPSG